MENTLKFGNNDTFENYLSNYKFTLNNNLFSDGQATRIEDVKINRGTIVPKYVNEFWTSKQRQASSLHEISYRACFKPQLPSFFINLLTEPTHIVYDPFSGRGTTVLEAALLGRNIIANDINPLSEILCKPRLFIPEINEVKKRLDEITITDEISLDINLDMFFQKDTLREILSIREYLTQRKKTNTEDEIDSWIRMVATNRLTGHSKGFFSVYTLPPNQAISAEKQTKINLQRRQKPEYRNTKEIILLKTKDLLRNVTKEQKLNLSRINKQAIFLNNDARETNEICDNIVHLTVTSPPFLDIVQYADDNWLRCWFNNINVKKIESRITSSKKIEDWIAVMTGVFHQLYRITKPRGYIAFEVGEVRNGRIKLDEYIIEIGLKQNLKCLGVMINEQIFTKTSNIWGISNNNKGTNTNRIVIFRK